MSGMRYTKNKRVWDKQQKRISELLERPYENLSIQEKLEIAYDKFFRHEKISYDEYVMIVTIANDEIWFLYKNTEYQIDHGISNVTTMYITEYDGQKKISERSENYSSVIELLDKFKIEGKAIKDIWNDVKF